MQKHINPSPAQHAIQNWNNNKIVKAKMHLTVSFVTHAGFQREKWSTDTIIIHRADILHVHDYARTHCCLRDYLFIRLPMKIGLRTGEIRTLRVEDINFENRSFQVLDSKRKEFYPLPLDMLTLQLIQDLVENKSYGYVFTRIKTWKNVKHDEPVTRKLIWHTVGKIGVEAGVPGVTPRLLRAWFADNWIYVKKKSREMLQKILRHKYSSTTDIYVNKFWTVEDVQREYDGENQPLSQNSLCNNCGNMEFCKFTPLPSHVTGCRFQKQKGERKVVKA